MIFDIGEQDGKAFIAMEYLDLPAPWDIVSEIRRMMRAVLEVKKEISGIRAGVSFLKSKRKFQGEFP